MTNPNTNALISLLNDAIRQPKPTGAGFKTVYVGKEKYPLRILETAPVNGNGWKKRASFEIIFMTIRAQVDVQNTADLISVTSQEFPINVTTAFIESTRAENILPPTCGLFTESSFSLSILQLIIEERRTRHRECHNKGKTPYALKVGDVVKSHVQVQSRAETGLVGKLRYRTKDLFIVTKDLENNSFEVQRSGSPESATRKYNNT